jgi:hypothetical protein
MHMLREVLPPGMQHGGHAQLPSKVFRIGGKGAERRPHALKQQTINYLRMALHPRVQEVGQRINVNVQCET